MDGFLENCAYLHFEFIKSRIAKKDNNLFDNRESQKKIEFLQLLRQEIENGKEKLQEIHPRRNAISIKLTKLCSYYIENFLL